MPTVNIDGSNNPIKLSIAELSGNPIQTVISIDNVELANKPDDITDLEIGTNKTLHRKAVIITITASKISPSPENVIVFTLSGAVEEHVDRSVRPFGNSSEVNHNMTYQFFLQ